MSTKYLFFVLGAFLLVQCSNGNAIDAKTDEPTAEEKQNLENAAFEFINSTVSGMFHLIDTTFSATRTAFEPIFAEIAAAGDAAKTEMQKKVERLEKLLDKMGKLKDDKENQDDKVDFIDELGAVFNDFQNFEHDEQLYNLTDFDTKVLNAQEGLRTDLKKSFTEYVDSFVSAAEKYWNVMPPKAQELQQDFHDTFTKLKNEEDIETKVKILKDFIIEAIVGSSEETN